MTDTGETYTTASVTIGSPQQVGGVQATAYAKIDARLQRIVEIVVTNPGSGYTSEPSVSIEGDGAGATAISRIRGESHAVEMGVGISEDASVATKFKFPSPIYLENNTEYAFVVVSNSIDYNMYISRLGENENWHNAESFYSTISLFLSSSLRTLLFGLLISLRMSSLL